MVMPTQRVQLPDTAGLFQKDQRENEYTVALSQRLSAELGARARDDVARSNVLLLSPGGSVYALYVDDAGAVLASKVSG